MNSKIKQLKLDPANYKHTISIPMAPSIVEASPKVRLPSFKTAETPQTINTEAPEITLNRIIRGDIKDEINDSAHLVSLSEFVVNNGKSTPVLLNKKNYDLIVSKHGKIDHQSLIDTARNYTNGFYFKSFGEPDKMNLLKQGKNNYLYVIGANKFNGYGVVTFFDQVKPRKIKNYIKALRRRDGIEFKK